MKKRSLALVLALSMMASMVGCSGGTAPTASTETSTALSQETSASKEETPKTDFPSKGLTLIVPWNAGGASDLIGRLLVAEMGETMGQNFSVVNTPGASGSVGMNDCFNKPHDGYTMIANATPYNHKVMGLADWMPEDWSFLGAYYVPGIIAVSKDSKYKTFNDLYEAIKAAPDAVSGGTSGTGSAGYINMEKLKSVAPEFGNYQHVAYSGGSAVMTATLAGEVDFTPQLSNEMIDLLRSGDLVALAALTEEDLELSGVSYTIPSIKNFLPQTESVLPCGDTFGLLFPSDVPQDVQKVIEEAYLNACQSDAAKQFADEKGVILVAMNLEESAALRDDMASTVNWILYDGGVAKVCPSDIGIERK